MTYTVNFDEKSECIMVAVSGLLDLQLLQNLAADVSALIKKHGCKRILNDMRKAILKNDAETFFMPKQAERSGVMPWCKRAIVVSDKNTNFKFLETVFTNQGHQVKIFTDINEAKRWLRCE